MVDDKTAALSAAAARATTTCLSNMKKQNHFTTMSFVVHFCPQWLNDVKLIMAVLLLLRNTSV